MSTSILWTAFIAIEDAIKGIAIADGYSCNWGSVGEYDSPHRTLPSANVDIVTEENQGEEPWVNAYSNKASMTIEIEDSINEGVQYPHREVREKLYQRIDDIKRLIGLNSSLGGVFLIQYKGFEITKTDDAFTSGKAIVSLSIDYTQDRTSPLDSAC